MLRRAPTTGHAKGWEGLLRYDYVKPNKDVAAAAKIRKIAGVAYWFHTQQAPATGGLERA